jgi:capsular exopolysaccharide synthesis family protein
MSKNFELLQRSKRPELRGTVSATSGDVMLPARPLSTPSARAAEKINWIRAFEAIRKHWKLSALFAALVFTTVALVTFLMTPVYEPETVIEISPPGTETFTLDGRTVEPSNDAEYLGTQVKNLQSDELALLVIRKLHLDQNPEFVGSRKFAPPAQAPTNEDAPRLTPAENVALKHFQKQLTAERDSSSRLVTVKFASNDPQVAAQVTNNLVSEYVDQSFRTRHDAIMKSTAWLSKQLDDIRAKMDEANRALSDFQKSTGIADVDPNHNTVAEQMGELNRQLAVAQADRIQSEAFLGKAERSNPETLPQFRDSPVVQQLSQKLGEARAELSQAAVLYGANHPKYKQLQGQVEELQAQLNLQKRAVVAALSTHYIAGRSREQLLDREIKNTARDLNQLAQYNTLKKQAQTETDLYNSLYSRVKEAGIAAASRSPNVRVVDPARVLDTPTRPRKALNLIFGLLAGAFGGVLLGFVMESVDNRLHTPEDVRQVTGISTVSVLPRIARRPSSELPSNGAGELSRSLHGSSHRFFLDRPASPEAEAMRGLYTSIMLSRWGTPPQVLAIVSAFPGEGKTTVASNLAIALAQQGPTCLVDGDLRKAGIAATFGVKDGVGLGDVLFGSVALKDTIHAVPDVPNLSIVSAGKAHRNPGELFARSSIREIIGELRERFTFVLFDSPPILPYIDGRVISTMVDGVIFVGRSGSTTREAITRSVELLSEINAAPILDVVLNAASVASDARYYRYQY